MSTEVEKQSSPELEATKTPYESNLKRLQNFAYHHQTALGVENMRWDVTDSALFPPAIFETSETANYEDTSEGRMFRVANTVAAHFRSIGYSPQPRILIQGLADEYLPAIIKLEKVLPDKKAAIAGHMTQVALLTLRNIQLDQKTRPSSFQDSQLTALMLEDLSHGMPEAPDASSSDPDFMRKDGEDLSSFLHEKVELIFGPENNEDFCYFRKAVRFAEKSHGDQKRFDGTLNRSHLLRLGIRLLEDPTFMQDPTPLRTKLASALLHDTIEDTDATFEEIEQEFGPVVKSAVDALSRSVRTTGKKRSDEDYYEILTKQPKFVQEIKGHDRVDNLEALLQLDLNSEDRIEIIEKGIKYLDETYKFYYDLVSDSPYLLDRLQKAHHAALQFYPQFKESVA